MKKSLLCLVLALTLLFALSLPVLAAGDQFIFDEADLLSDEELEALEARAEEISEEYDCGVYIAVVEDYLDYSGSVSRAAENFYDSQGLGLHSDYSGILLLMSMDDRDYYVYHYGYGTYTVERWSSSDFDAPMLRYFRNDDWYEGFRAYLDTCDEALEDAERSYDPADFDQNGNYIGGSQGPGLGASIVIGLIVGCLVALIVCSVQKGKMRSVRAATTAAQYMAGHLNLYQSFDNFTHITESRVKIESDSSRSGGGGRPSGGGGGHGGKF